MFYIDLRRFSNYHATQENPASTITMQLQESPSQVLLGLHGNSTQGLLLKNQYCLECRDQTNIHSSSELCQ